MESEPRRKPPDMIARFLLFFLPLFPLLAGDALEMSKAAKRKLDRIALAELARGETIVLSEDELNSFLQHHGNVGIPPGVTDVRVRLREGGASVEAVIAEETAAQLEQADAPVLVRLLLRSSSGSRIRADVDYAAAGGIGAAKVTAAAIDDFTLSGAVLDWFLQAFAPQRLRPYISGEPIPLEGGLDSVRVMPGRIVFTAR